MAHSVFLMEFAQFSMLFHLLVPGGVRLGLVLIFDLLGLLIKELLIKLAVNPIELLLVIHYIPFIICAISCMSKTTHCNQAYEQYYQQTLNLIIAFGSLIPLETPNFHHWIYGIIINSILLFIIVYYFVTPSYLSIQSKTTKFSPYITYILVCKYLLFIDNTQGSLACLFYNNSCKLQSLVIIMMKQSMPAVKRADISKQNQSKIRIQQYEDRMLQQQIKKVKYPTHAISNAQNLKSKIQSFKNEKIREKLATQLKQFNCYRKIRGDGNCFFRALAFSYLSSIPKPTFYECFPNIKQINLACCYPDTIPKQFKKFYDHRFLSKMLAKYWDYFELKLQKCNKNSAKALLKMFDQYPFLDFIVILYFRSLCLKYLWKFQDQLKQFLLGKQQQYIRRYSSQTEGVPIKVCSSMLKIVIHVYQIRKDVISTYHYDQMKEKNSQIHLLFYQNHYDIIEYNERIQQEKDALSQNLYYSNVDTKLVLGKCIQCYREGRVYQQSSVCVLCFDKMERAAQKYDGKKLVRGFCQDCRRFKDNVYEQLNICKSCIQIQNKIQSKRLTQQKSMVQIRKQKRQQDQNGTQIVKIEQQNQVQKSKQKQKQQKQKQNQRQKKEVNRVFGVCLQCNSRVYINDETGICIRCQQKQKLFLNRIEDKKNQELRTTVKKQKGQNGKIKNNYVSPQKDKKVARITEGEKTSSTYKQPQNREIDRRQTKNLGSEQASQLSFQIKNTNKIKQCQNCRQRAVLQQGTQLCMRCYMRVFNKSDQCSACKYKMSLHYQTLKCKQCHYKSKKSNLGDSNMRCYDCKKKQIYRKGYCYTCYNKFFR